MATKGFEVIIATTAFTAEDYFAIEYGEAEEVGTGEPTDDGPIELDDDGEWVGAQTVDMLRRWSIEHADHDLVIVLSRVGEAVCAQYTVVGTDPSIVDACIRDYEASAKRLGAHIENQS